MCSNTCTRKNTRATSTSIALLAKQTTPHCVSKKTCQSEGSLHSAASLKLKNLTGLTFDWPISWPWSLSFSLPSPPADLCSAHSPRLTTPFISRNFACFSFILKVTKKAWLAGTSTTVLFVQSEQRAYSLSFTVRVLIEGTYHDFQSSFFCFFASSQFFLWILTAKA